MRVRLYLQAIVLLISTLVLSPARSEAQGTDSKTAADELIVFHAGSLSRPFERLAKAYEERYPGTKVLREAAGSRVTARKVTELKRDADIVGSADYTVIQELMMPSYADWFVCFASNEMVIAFTDHSRYASELTKDNWIDILLRDGVSFGHSDPNKDPCGYRALMVWKLADLHDKKKINGKTIFEAMSAACPPSNVLPIETELVAMLSGGTLDYIFQYRSLAEQHSLRYIKLPDEINLANPQFAATYSKVSVETTGQKRGSPPSVMVGTPIVYAFTIPKSAPHLLAARRFADLLLGPAGQKIFNEEYQTVIPGGRIGFLETTVPQVLDKGRSP